MQTPAARRRRRLGYWLGSLLARFGEPAWKGDAELRAASDADEIFGYERSPYALALYFLGGKLTAVELGKAR